MVVLPWEHPPGVYLGWGAARGDGLSCGRQMSVILGFSFPWGQSLGARGVGEVGLVAR